VSVITIVSSPGLYEPLQISVLPVSSASKWKTFFSGKAVESSCNFDQAPKIPLLEIFNDHGSRKKEIPSQQVPAITSLLE
jgi:hypothetical protein